MGVSLGIATTPTCQLVQTERCVRYKSKRVSYLEARMNSAVPKPLRATTVLDLTRSLIPNSNATLTHGPVSDARLRAHVATLAGEIGESNVFRRGVTRRRELHPMRVDSHGLRRCHPE